MSGRHFFEHLDRAPIDWGKYRQMITLELREAVGLSVNLHSAGLDIIEAYPQTPETQNHEFRPAIDEFQRRLEIANNHKEAGTLTVRYIKGVHHVSMKDFRSWAVGLKWDLPEEFPGDPEERSILKLPWRSENLDKLANELSKFGPENPLPESSAELGMFFDKIFGWSPDNNSGSHSRSAQTLVSILGPTKSRTGGLKKNSKDGKTSPVRR